MSMFSTTSRSGPAVGAKVAFTSANLMKGFMAVLISGALFFAWRMVGPSSALAWNSDLDAARAQAALIKKPILVYFTADWCPPCREFKKSTLMDEGVASSLEKDWVLVKVDLSERGSPNSKIAQSLGVNSIPTFQVYTIDGQQLDSRRGYTTPAVFLAWLQTCKQRMN